MSRRGGEIKCPICFDGLFNALDDLDEVIPAVVTECGHGYHKTCIEQWFVSQAEQYVAAMEPRQSEYDDPITIADAPALCPSCREECFADPDSGEVKLTKLFFTMEDRMDGSSQVGSSPVRPTPRSNKAASAELMGLARRAKNITADVAGLDCDASQTRVIGALDRADALTHDVASAKAIQAVKRYIGGLTSAINTFRSQLKESPLPAILRRQLDEYKYNASVSQREIERLVTQELQPQIQRTETANHELKLSQKRVKRLTEEMDETRKRLKEVQTTSAAQMKNMKESFVHMKEDRDKAIERAAKAEEDAKARISDLNERTRQLKSYKAKNTDLRTRYEDIEKENKQLQRVVKDLQVPARATTQKQVEDGDHDMSYPEELVASSSPTRPASPMRPNKPVNKRTFIDIDADDSLSIEMPSFEDSTRLQGSSPPSPKHSTSGLSRGRQHPTARSYQFDASKSSPGARRRSKYFSGPPNKTSSGLSGDITNELVASSGSDDDDEPRVLIPATSSPHRAPNFGMSRTNPFHTTRLESVAKTDAKLKRKPTETIEIGDSTDGDSPLRLSETNVPTYKAGTAPTRKAPTLGKTPSAMLLGLVDRNGRPLKNVASGSRVKRRA